MIKRGRALHPGLEVHLRDRQRQVDAGQFHRVARLEGDDVPADVAAAAIELQRGDAATGGELLAAVVGSGGGGEDLDDQRGRA